MISPGEKDPVLLSYSIFCLILVEGGGHDEEPFLFAYVSCLNCFFFYLLRIKLRKISLVYFYHGSSNWK